MRAGWWGKGRGMDGRNRKDAQKDVDRNMDMMYLRMGRGWSGTARVEE